MALKTVIRLADQAAGFITNSSASTTYATKASPTFSGSVSFLDSASFYYDGTARDTLFLNNNNITGVGNIEIQDPGANEGISWAGGNLWKIYESPDDLSNAAGNLQFVQNATRRLTIDATTGDVTTQKSLYIGDERTTTEQTTLHIGAGRTGNGYAYIDLVGDTGYPDYGARFLRGNSGSNTLTQILHKGTGALQITAVEAGSIALGTSNTSRLGIDSAGRITMPSQPAFRYHGFTINGSGMQGGSAPLNVGSSLAVYPVGNANYTRFTAPIAGKYVFGFSVLIEQNGGRNEIVLRKNGSTSIDGYSYYSANDFGGGTNQYVTAVNTFILNLAANDYVDFYHAVVGTLWSDLARGDRQFWGYLLG